MMDVPIPSLDTYVQRFERAELTVEQYIHFGHPQEYLFIARASEGM